MLSNIGIFGPQQQELDRRLRRELRPRRHVHQHARRHVRRVQGARLHELDAAQPPVQRPDAVHGRGHREPDGDVPAAQSGDAGSRWTWATSARTPAARSSGKRYSPWYFRVDGNQVKQSGTKVGSGSNGTSPGNGFTDLPLPVAVRDQQRHRRDRLRDEGDDAVRELPGEQLRQREQARSTGTTGSGATASTRRTCRPTTTTSASRSTARAGSCRGTRRWRCATPGTRRRATSTIGQTILNGVGSFTPLLPDTPTFNGDEKRQTFTAGWSATPVANLDTRVYFNWQKMNNDSTLVTFCPSDRQQLRRHLHQRAVGLRQAERGLRRVLPDQPRQPDRRRVRLQPHQAEPRRLRRHAHQHVLGRVAQHLARQRDRADQVLVPQAATPTSCSATSASMPTTRRICSASSGRSTWPTSRRTG